MCHSTYCCGKVSGGAMASNIAASLRMTDRLTLVVDDTRFVVEPDVFRQYPDTMLGRLFALHFRNN